MKEKQMSVGPWDVSHLVMCSQVAKVASQEKEKRKADTESSGYLAPQWLEVQRPV